MMRCGGPFWAKITRRSGKGKIRDVGYGIARLTSPILNLGSQMTIRGIQTKGAKDNNDFLLEPRDGDLASGPNSAILR